jgi:hypothetical protein
MTPATLFEAVAAYQDGLIDYNANAPADNEGADAYAKISYVLPMEVLEGWTDPARSREEAIAALKLALQETKDFYSSGPIAPMIGAALAYLEGAR